ncbi:MAG: PEP/pyruvate-binding domain-containing protein, partial [Anaerolineae bacterium]
MTYIRWFDGTQKDDIALTGGKGANLGEMVRAGLPVPPGFIVTTQAYRAFVQANDLQPRILELARAADPASPEAASQSIRQLFDQGTIPQPIADVILGAYHSLSMQSSASSDHPLSESA